MPVLISAARNARLYNCRVIVYSIPVIRSFRHKGLHGLFARNDASRVRPDLVARCRVRLSALDSATALRDMNLPGFDFHPLRGRPVRHSVHVNGPWCITFEWIDGDAWRVDLEQYH